MFLAVPLNLSCSSKLWCKRLLAQQSPKPDIDGSQAAYLWELQWPSVTLDLFLYLLLKRRRWDSLMVSDVSDVQAKWWIMHNNISFKISFIRSPWLAQLVKRRSPPPPLPFTINCLTFKNSWQCQKTLIFISLHQIINHILFYCDTWHIYLCDVSHECWLIH